MLKKIIGGLFVTLFLLIGIVLINTFRFKSKQINVKAISYPAISSEVIDHLQRAVQIPTISHTDTTLIDYTKLQDFQILLKQLYPLVATKLESDTINGYSLLFKWEGKDLSSAPVLFMAHQDVVPIENSDAWEEPPFAGIRKNGYLYGRGTLDDKLSVLGWLEAAELLLAKDFQPKRTTYFFFGHDEEIGGRGAQAAVRYFQDKNIRFEYVLDEGMVILSGMMPGVKEPVGLIGLAEKGYASVELTASATGGHSSMPPPHSAIGLLAKTINNLQENPMPQRLDGATWKMFEYMGPEMPFMEKAVFANSWITSGIIKNILSDGVATNATTRTTMAPTILQAGSKDNILPAEAKAVLNFRILPGDTKEEVMKYVQKHLASDKVSAVFLKGAKNPTPVSRTNTVGFNILQETIMEICPSCKVGPALTIAGTDGGYFTAVTDNVYRFLPVLLQADDLKRIHGSNERINVKSYMELIVFYMRMLEKT